MSFAVCPVRRRIFAALAGLVMLAGGAIFSAGTGAQTPAETPLRIAVYGATGSVGSRIVTEALARGHSVTGISRSASEETSHHARLTYVDGDVTVPDSVARLVAGHDAVISAIGGENDSPDPADSVPAQAARALVAALRQLGSEAPRMMVVGGGSTTLDERPGVPYVDPLDIPTGPRGVRMRGHRVALEYLQTLDDVRWTFIAPALEMEPGVRTGEFRVGDGSRVLRDRNGESAISIEDMAVAMIDELENPRYVNSRMTAAY